MGGKSCASDARACVGRGREGEDCADRLYPGSIGYTGRSPPPCRPMDHEGMMARPKLMHRADSPFPIPATFLSADVPCPHPLRPVRVTQTWLNSKCTSGAPAYVPGWYSLTLLYFSPYLSFLHT